MKLHFWAEIHGKQTKWCPKFQNLKNMKKTLKNEGTSVSLRQKLIAVEKKLIVLFFEVF